MTQLEVVVQLSLRYQCRIHHKSVCDQCWIYRPRNRKFYPENEIQSKPQTIQSISPKAKDLRCALGKCRTQTIPSRWPCPCWYFLVSATLLSLPLHIYYQGKGYPSTRDRPFHAAFPSDFFLRRCQFLEILSHSRIAALFFQHITGYFPSSKRTNPLFR